MNEKTLTELLAEIEEMSAQIVRNLRKMCTDYGIEARVECCRGLPNFQTDGTMQLMNGIEAVEKALGKEAVEIRRCESAKKVIERSEGNAFSYIQLAKTVTVMTEYAKAEVDA